MNADVGAVLRAQLEAQPWWRRMANTVTAVVGAVVGIAWLVIALGVDLPPQVMASVSAVIALGTAFGVKHTPNGVTARQVEELEDYIGKHRADG